MLFSNQRGQELADKSKDEKLKKDIIPAIAAIKEGMVMSAEGAKGLSPEGEQSDADKKKLLDGLSGGCGLFYFYPNALLCMKCTHGLYMYMYCTLLFTKAKSITVLLYIHVYVIHVSFDLPVLIFIDNLNAND